MINGWFVGNFEPSLYKTNDVEVAVPGHVGDDRAAPDRRANLVLPE